MLRSGKLPSLEAIVAGADGVELRGWGVFGEEGLLDGRVGAVYNVLQFRNHLGTATGGPWCVEVGVVRFPDLIGTPILKSRRPP